MQTKPPQNPLAETGNAMAALPDCVVQEHPHPKTIPLESIGMIVLLALVWGSSFILMKKSLIFFTPIEVGALRMVVAGVFMLPLALSRLHTIQKKHVPFMLLSGFVGSFLPSFLFATAGLHIDSGISGSLNGLSPLFTLLIGLAVFNVRTSWQGYVGIFLGLAGALALSLVRVKEGATLNEWTLLVVLATILYAININLVKNYLHEAKPITITAVALVPVGTVSAIILLFFTPFASRTDMPGFWGVPLACAVTLGVFGSALSIMAYNRLIKQVSALVASTVTYLMPVVALLWGLWDGEQIQIWQLAGLAMVLGGMGLVALAKR